MNIGMLRSLENWNMLFGSMEWLLAVILKPLIALIFLGFVCLPFRLLAQKLPDNLLRRILLYRITKE